MYRFNLLKDILSSNEEYFNSSPKTWSLIFYGSLVLLAIIGYLIGSVNFSIIISKIKYKDDIRDHGSGNAGSTNMVRTHGTAAGILTFAGDLAKTAIAVFIGAFVYNLPGAYICGFFCVIGHIYPIFFKFKGGKGVATVAMLVSLTNIRVFIVLIVIFLILAIGTRYISLGSVVSVILYPLLLFKILDLFKSTKDYEYIGVLFAFLLAVIITWKHRENLKRIYNHTESKFSFSKHGSDSSVTSSEGGEKDGKK